MDTTNTFECDKAKARQNFLKHQLRFTESCRIFAGHTLTAPSKHNAVNAEERFTTIGVLDNKVAAVVVWTKRAGNIRVISARTASRNERELYNACIKKTAH